MKFYSTKNTISAFLMLVSTLAFSQNKCNSYYPEKVGSVMEREEFNGKGKLTGTLRQTILSNTADGDKSEIKIKNTVLDKKGEESSSTDFTVTCDGESMEVSMESVLDPERFKSFETMDMKVEADNLSLPNDLTVGQVLPGGKIKVSITNMGMSIFKMTTIVSERKVEAKESITTKAGTFDCIKITYTVKSQISIKAFEFQITEWYSKGHGVIKSEKRDKNGKLKSYSELSKIQ